MDRFFPNHPFKNTFEFFSLNKKKKKEKNRSSQVGLSLFSYTQNLKGDLLLIHGTVDDVVVMQHNLALVKKFVEEGTQIDFFPYPMHPHNVRGKDRVHLMTKVLNYVEEKIAKAKRAQRLKPIKKSSTPASKDKKSMSTKSKVAPNKGKTGIKSKTNKLKKQ